MPVAPPELPDTVPECHKVILEYWSKNTELAIQAERTVGGFLSRNGTSIIAIVVGIVAAVGSNGAWFQSDSNHKKIEAAQVVQQEIKKTTDAVERRTNEVGSGVDDIKREASRKKGPFE